MRDMQTRLERLAFMHMLLRHGVATLAACMIITALLTLAEAGSWDVNLVYSLAIGFICWISIEIGRHFFRRDKNVPWPNGWRGTVVVLASVLIGFGVGSFIGHAYQVRVRPHSSLVASTWWLMSVFITLVTSGLMSFMFYMIGKSRQFELQAAQAEKQAAEARLTLLQTQLEPHMLFNTLANLRVLIATDPDRAQEMLDHLIAYLRATLGHSRSTEHPLREEFARLQDYLALMQIRMGKRLHFTLDLPEALADIPVPPMLLQPLVENSIRHGLEPQIQGGTIDVIARQIGDAQTPQIELIVSDTGGGLPQAISPANSSAHQHFGTAQVCERLATRYGPGATFELKNRTPHHGVLARIVFPLKQP